MYKQTLMFPQRQIIYVTRWYLDTFKKSKIRLQRKLNEYFFCAMWSNPFGESFSL